MATKFRALCVFCGAHSGTNPAFEQAARAMGTYLAENRIRLIYGGGKVGLMGAVADACIEGGGEVVGVITRYLQGRELAHPAATEMHIVENMLHRKQRMGALSDAFISLPGGIGTLDEMFEMLTWARLQEHDKPSGLLNVEGFYDELIAFCGTTQVEAGFISAEDAANLLWSDNIPDLIQKLEEASRTGPSSLYRK